ncbi:MAG TPA: hypothetical protein DEP82_14640 [Arthrobacter bacterium]|jgi:hypothetical protein|nr:hypothetical protein [Arthrobacter sp.]
MTTRIQYRRDTAANWTAVNPVLAAGEPGYETETDKYKIGDGVSAWSALVYHSDDAANNSTYAGSGLLSTPRPRQPLNANLLTSFQAGHGWTSANTPLSVADDTTDYTLGKQSIKVVTTTANDPASIQKTGLTLDVTGKTFRIWFKVDGLANLSEVLLYAGDTALANTYSWVLLDGLGVSAQQFTKDGEWISMTVSWGDVTVVGTPNRAALQNVRLRVRAINGQSVTAHFNGVALVNEPTAYPSGVISLTYDDSKASQATEGQMYLDKYGFGGTYYTICDRIDTAGYMTMAQLKAIANYTPSEIAAHAYTVANHDTTFPNLAPDVLDAELRNMRVWLQSNGFKGGDHIAYPQGAFTAGVLDTVNKYYGSGRTILFKLETLRPANPLRLRSLSVSNLTTVATVTSAIDRAYANKSWLILTFHDLVTTPVNGTEYSIANYQTIIDYIATKGIPVQPVGEVMQTISPAILPAVAQSGQDPVSMLANIDTANGNTATSVNAMRPADATTAFNITNGTTHVTCFTPIRDVAITKLAASSGSPAWAGTTLARLGLYTVTSAGVATLVAVTANDTTLFATANTVYEKSLDTAGGYPASYTLVAGQRYAIGVIGMGTTAGALRGGIVLNAISFRITKGGNLGAGGTDLATSGTIAANGTYPWAAATA